MSTIMGFPGGADPDFKKLYLWSCWGNGGRVTIDLVNHTRTTPSWYSSNWENHTVTTDLYEAKWYRNGDNGNLTTNKFKLVRAFSGYIFLNNTLLNDGSYDYPSGYTFDSLIGNNSYDVEFLELK